MEDTDGGLVGTAIRETEEELGISEDRIEVLGEIGPTEVNGGGSMSVWPFVVKKTSKTSCLKVNGLGLNRDSSIKMKNGTSERRTILCRLSIWRPFGRPFQQWKLPRYFIFHWK